MRTIDWDAHSKHRTQVAGDTGQWLGLVDEDFIPLLDLPPLSGMDWKDSRGAIDSVELTVNVRTPSGRPHAIVSELIADGLGRVDEVGKLIPFTGPARLISWQRPGGVRSTMRVTHTTAEGDAESPHTLTIHGVSIKGYLDLLPCPSNPLSWTGNFTRFERDWVGPEDTTALFDHPRDLASCTMINVADGASVDGMADEVIYRLMQESFDAVHRVAGVEKPVYVAVLDAPRGEQQRMIHRPTDQTIWQELGDRALTAGVSIRPQLWWPGDPQPAGMTLELPTLVFRIRQEA